MTFAPFPPSNVAEAIEVFKQDVEIVHIVAQGDENTEVLTENGMIPSIAKTIKDFTDEIANVSYIPIGSFQDGGIVTLKNHIVSDGSSYWRWDGALPKVVTAGSEPLPVGVGGWFLVGGNYVETDALAATNSTVLIGGVEAEGLAKNYGFFAQIPDPLVADSFSLFYGEPTYFGNIGAGSMLVGGYYGASKNRIIGSPAQLRGVIGGYDNEISSASTADGLACGIVWSMHSKISTDSDHSGIGFGSYHEIERGSYAAILSGTRNKIVGTTNPNKNQNSVIVGGARNEVDGANCTVSGTDNKTRGNALTAFGLLNNIGLTVAANGSFTSGQSNTVEREYGFTVGLSNTNSRNYTFVAGRSNQATADYAFANGRGGVAGVAFSQTFGFDTGSATGSNQRDRYPLQRTTTDATSQNLVSVLQGSVGDVMPDNTVCFARATVCATSGTDVKVIELKACLRRTGGTTAIYNTQTVLGETAGATTWTATFGGQNDRRIVVTGEAGKTIKWTADVELVTTQL